MAATACMSKQLQLKLVGTVVEFMVRSGVSDHSIEESFKKGLKRSRALRSGVGSQYRDGRYLQNGDVSADLLRLWHRDSRLLTDSDASPRPLQLLKGKHSIRSLILGLHKEANVDAVLSFLKAAQLIRRTSDGRYLPTREAGAITQDGSFVVEHLVRSVIRLFSTMRRNTSTAGIEEPLIERYAYVSDLNPGERKAFAEFTRSQGHCYLQAVDDWMEQRRIGRIQNRARRAKKGVVAGVQIVAYLGDSLGADAGAKVGRSEKVRTPPRAQARRRGLPTPPSTPA